MIWMEGKSDISGIKRVAGLTVQVLFSALAVRL